MKKDTILCSDKEEAKAVIDDLGAAVIDDFEYLGDGRVRIILNCALKDLKGAKNDKRL